MAMNRDEGGYRLIHVWDSLLATPSSEQEPLNIQFLKKAADGGRNVEVSRIASCVIMKFVSNNILPT